LDLARCRRSDLRSPTALCRHFQRRGPPSCKRRYSLTWLADDALMQSGIEKVAQATAGEDLVDSRGERSPTLKFGDGVGGSVGCAGRGISRGFGRPLEQGARPEPGTPERIALFNAYNEADAAMRRAGVLVECAPLEPTSSSTTVRVRDGETLLTDGPAADIKEPVGGFALIECADLDEAIRWAATIPAAKDASVEIRPLANVEVPT
jgi:hypothetical protein